MPRYLVTGGAGFIGSHLVDALVARGDEVHVVDDLSSGSLENLRQSMDKLRFFEGSISNTKLLDEAATGCSGVFHLAAVVSVMESIHNPIRTHEVNSLGSLCVIEAAKKHGMKVVFSSSAAIYGNEPALPTPESATPAPISPYGVQKLETELLLSAYESIHALDSVSLRYFNVYGPRQDPSSPYSGVISIFVNRGRQGLPVTIYGDGQQTRDFVFVGDVVRANLLAMSNGNSGAVRVNIATGRPTTLLELVRAVEAATARSLEVHHGEARSGDIRHSVAAVQVARDTLGWTATTELLPGLEGTVLPK